MKKKSALIAMAIVPFLNVSTITDVQAATMTMYDANGAVVASLGSITTNFDINTMTFDMSSINPFFGYNWTAHDGILLSSGVYNFDTIQGGTYQDIMVGAGQLGGHILFDWASVTDIDLVFVWDVPTPGTYVPVDVIATNPTGPDGVLGIPMIDGPFVGISPAEVTSAVGYSINLEVGSPVPVPAAVWLFGSGLVGLIGMAKSKTSKK